MTNGKWLIVIGIATSLFSLGAYVCAIAHGYHGGFAGFYQQTIMPMSWNEFLFPPCPFCWVVRLGIIITLIGLLSVRNEKRT